MSLDSIINWELLSHPYNWVIVILILAISTMALCLLAAPLGQIGGITQVF